MLAGGGGRSGQGCLGGSRFKRWTLSGGWTAPWPPRHTPRPRTQSGTEFALEKVGQGSVRSWGQSKPGDWGQGWWRTEVVTAAPTCSLKPGWSRAWEQLFRSNPLRSAPEKASPVQWGDWKLLMCFPLWGDRTFALSCQWAIVSCLSSFTSTVGRGC